MKSLAVMAPHAGVVSESFIKRHMLKLHPGHTCIVANQTRSGVDLIRDKVPLLVLNEKRAANRSYLAQGRQKILQKARMIPRDLDREAIKQFLRKHRVEVILAEYLDYSVGLIDLARELGIPLYAHAHGYDVSINLQDKRWLERYLTLNEIDGVITVSHYSKQRLLDIGVDAAKVTVIPCGVSLVPTKIPAQSDRNKVSLIAIGRMVSKKAPILLLDAYRRALEEVPNLHLTYVGDGPLYAAVWQYVRAFGLEKKVTLYGALPNEQALLRLAAADIFVQHSITCPLTGDQEGLPVAILEALSYGVPVVATRHTGIPEAVEDGKNGLLVDELDAVGMAQAIIALATDPFLRQTMGVAARATAEAKFSWKLEKERLRRLMSLG